MNVFDYLLIAAVGIGIFFSIRYLYQQNKKGGCIGCSGCSGCSGCPDNSNCPDSFGCRADTCCKDINNKTE